MSLQMPVAAPSRRSLRLAACALALAGAVALAASAYQSGWQGNWLLASVFTSERILPLVGLGLLLGQLPRRALPFALASLVLGAAAGILLREPFFALMAQVPGAAAHLFLTGPIACVLIGLPLVLPRGARVWIALPLLAPTGPALAIATLLGDPTLHEWSYRPLAFAAEIWLSATAALAAAAFDRAWLTVAARIFASWLIAIGFLYGGAYMATRRTALEPPPFPALPADGAFPGFGRVLQELDGKEPAG
ncbi:hypothetical protein [Ciceribacter azotifigens]|uniref:hypothetical protein n=1 Tax=Ciceribacter azotifigens TaxID=2069303 RepID=UPI003A86D795